MDVRDRTADHSLFTEAMAVLSAKSCPFATLSNDLREALLATMRVREFAAGEYLIRQGVPGDHLLVILDGTAVASIRRPDSADRFVGAFGPGDVVGEISLLTGETRTADVVSRSRVRSLILSVADFNSVAAGHPEVRILLTNVVADRLGKATYDGLGGKDIQGYQISRCIGRGGMGIVYEATRVASGEVVAVKMMNHGLLSDRGAIQGFKREAETLRTLRHESIARLLETFFAYGTHFLVMEFCDGLTLKDLLARGQPLDETLVRRIVGQLVLALRCVHERGLIHRDLKPSNVMLTRSGVVKLLDFGLVKDDPAGAGEPGNDGRAELLSAALNAAGLVKLISLGLAKDEPAQSKDTDEDGGMNALTVSRSNVFQGTPAYMAPEQFWSRKVDRRADLYALACVAYEALSGHPVSRAHDVPGILQEKLHFVLPPAEGIGRGVSPEMHEFLWRGLSRHPDMRTLDLTRLSAWAGPVELTI